MLTLSSSQIQSPWLGQKGDSGIGLSYPGPPGYIGRQAGTQPSAKVNYILDYEFGYRKYAQSAFCIYIKKSWDWFIVTNMI